MKKEEYIHQRLDDQIHWYDKKSKKHQNWYKYLKIAEILLGTVIPVLTLLKFYYFDILVTLCSSLILVCESFIALYSHKENWIKYRQTTETLKNEKYMFLTLSGVYKDETTPFILLVERCETIISSENINWANLQTDAKNKEDKAHD
ncbi:MULTISPECIES: DUF4231 domain-containing protein [unclassified Granulicatella]|uniref:DUF4231 domain-containing protein n=1 Tax=unclassified Granulicatella TaxID=2630493 RepID=UPI0010732FD9|nr:MULTISPECIES: DUF4231 domain-containing protein [unclassified Granulicatella]MBF0781161.1 DUF4231 domain-containing protein [Granulicatella sp. 19428wC4_WM01]TFU91614.1 DUF4231 domain-containing protein [Granulicatella sp. WM01]